MYRYITEAERYQIEILLRQKYTIKQIAECLGHKYHTIYHEIKKGTVKQLDSLLAEHYVYKADYAQMISRQNMSNRGRNLKIGNDHKLAAYIEDMIKNKKYSPAALLTAANRNGLVFSSRICVKTIYNYIDMGLFLNISFNDLPYKKAVRKKKDDDTSSVALNNRKGRSIEKRDPSVMERSSYGHWEMDTVVGGQKKGKACLLVLSERMSREEIIIKLKDKRSSSVVHALNMLERRYGSRRFKEKFKTITCDNGVEFLDSKGIEKSRYSKGSRAVLYYCHPYSCFERGTNENINRMIRRFFPKGINFDDVKPVEIQKVEDWINNYPRPILGGLSSNRFRHDILNISGD